MENSNCNTSPTNSCQGRVGNPADDGGGSEDIGEAQDEEPSSSLGQFDAEDELENFRLQWKREIETSPSIEKITSTKKESVSLIEESTEMIEVKARHLFMCGAHAERAGKLQDALSYYRKAVQLVPDIEFRISKYINDNESDFFFEESDEESSYEDNSCSDDEETDNLVNKFQKLAAKIGTTCICEPHHEQNASHISVLPPEVFLHLLKWVVSQDLDVLSLEQVSKVCRGFYICARDPEIWRLVCIRIWEVNIDNPNKYGSWRNMYIQRPHLSYNGVYISKTSYIRYGEPSFQDTNYRPCYVVEYYRYLRFFPEGLVLMLTTTEEPTQSLHKLRYRQSRHADIMLGRYKLVSNTVMAVVKKQRRDYLPSSAMNYNRYRKKLANLPESCDQTFHLELEVKSVKRRCNNRLKWNRYSIHTIHRNGQESVSDFDLTPKSFPPFHFSRVKSFTAESESHLK